MEGGFQSGAPCGPDAFTSTERGRVRKTPEGYRAFFPSEAPRRLSLSGEVVKLLDEATGAVHRLGGSTLDDAVFVPPPPDEMRHAVSDLEKFLHETNLPLLAQLAVAHYQFEVIHPFLDGNGRIGRLMIPLMLVPRDPLPQPLL